MAQVVEQSHNIVSSIGSLAISLSDINQKMTESSDASNLISNALEEHNATSDEISMAITNLHDFLLEKSTETHIVSDQAKALCESTESIFIDLAEFKTGSLVDKICWQAQLAAAQLVATMFSDKIHAIKFANKLFLTLVIVRLPILIHKNITAVSMTLPINFYRRFKNQF